MKTKKPETKEEWNDLPLEHYEALPYKRRNQYRKVPLTVCVAAICNNNSIVGASDRMLTAGDIEFEPPEIAVPFPSKIHAMTNSIALMTAGDAGLQAEIVRLVYHAVAGKIQKEPDKWILVEEVVDFYLHFFTQLKRRRSVLEVLAPLGLDEYSFIAKQKEMSKEFIENIAASLTDFEMPQIGTIITGVDPTGAHIYSIKNRTGHCRATCYNSVGFAAVGIGARHAESQFMLAGHTRHSGLPESLLLTYSAKKRSEVAPGVGKGTDMFVIGPQMGTFHMLNGPTGILKAEMEQLDAIDKRIEEKSRRILEESKEEVKQFVEEIIKKRAVQNQQAEAPSEPPPTETNGGENPTQN